MSSKQIAYRVTGRDNESYIFLDRNSDNTYSVRSGSSIPTSHLTWEEDFTVQTVEEFLSSNPEHQAKVNELIAEFESESL